MAISSADHQIDHSIALTRLLQVEPRHMLVVEFDGEAHQVAFDSWSHDTMLLGLDTAD